MSVNIDRAQAMTLEIVQSLSKIVKNNLVLDEIEDNDELIESDYVSWDVSIGDNKYEFYHGFPGDNPVGIMMQGEELIAEVGEGGENIVKDSEDATLFTEWYNEVTKEACDYELDEFRAIKLTTKRSASGNNNDECDKKKAKKEAAEDCEDEEDDDEQ